MQAKVHPGDSDREAQRNKNPEQTGVDQGQRDNDREDRCCMPGRKGMVFQRMTEGFCTRYHEVWALAGIAFLGDGHRDMAEYERQETCGSKYSCIIRCEEQYEKSGNDRGSCTSKVGNGVKVLVQQTMLQPAVYPFE